MHWSRSEFSYQSIIAYFKSAGHIINMFESEKTRWIFQLSAILFLDLLVSFTALGFYHDEGLNFYPSTMSNQINQLRHGFDFCRCGVDFALLALLRLIFILMGIQLLRVMLFSLIFIVFSDANAILLRRVLSAFYVRSHPIDFFYLNQSARFRWTRNNSLLRWSLDWRMLDNSYQRFYDNIYASCDKNMGKRI